LRQLFRSRSRRFGLSRRNGGRIEFPIVYRFVLILGQIVIRLILAIGTTLATLAAAAQTPTPVQPVAGKHCRALAPMGWSFTAENPAGSAFGADLFSRDGAAGASYFIVGVAAELRTSPTYGRWYSTPHQAVLATLSQLGATPLQCAAPTAPAPGLHLMQCRTPQYVGLALYQVFPMGGNGFLLVIRTAATAPDRWSREGELVSAAARSIRCNVPLRPSTADFTTGLSGSGKSRRGKGAGDSEYSRWLGMEHYHDPATGKNYWVSPSRDWSNNCPQGAGYCVNIGGTLRQLEPGRSN
jgi:hypothetical protein